MKKFYFLFIAFLLALPSFAQQNISGVVTSSEDNEPIIGASVMIKGTSRGVSTNLDGQFTIQAQGNQTLVISYVGMESKEVPINNRTTINVTLDPRAEVLEEVVVTAMGIQTEKKKLNFAVQSVDGESLTDGKSQNFVNALQGKISGLSVTTSSGSPNAGTQILIRGISSINNAQNNEPLFVMDGIPLAGRGSAAADINPNDIENVTILKGAAASALYGQDAANGVVMITTKQGKVGTVSVNASASFQYDVPTRLRQIQTTYGPGAQGFYKEKTMGGWGPLLSDNVERFDNVGNFLNNGFFQKYDVSLNGGSEKFQAYASANYSKNNGIVPNDYLNRMGLLLKGTYQPFESLSVTMSANINERTSRGFGATSMSSVYYWPITDDITNYEEENGYPRYLYYNDALKYASPMSPLYSRYNDASKNRSTRNILNGSINFKPIKNLEIIGRVSFDSSHSNYDGYNVPRWDDMVVLRNFMEPFDKYFKFTPSCKHIEPGTPEWDLEYKAALDAALASYIESGKYFEQFDFPEPVTLSKDSPEYEAAMEAYNTAYEESLSKYREYYMSVPYLMEKDLEDMSPNSLGYYSASASRSQLFAASTMATYKINLPNEFDIDLLAGADLKMEEGFGMSNQGRDFITPGTFSLINTNPDYVYLADRNTSHREKRTFGYFGEIRGDYKGLASLSVTGRWDWSSTILANPYFYPSVTAGLLFSELFGITNKWFNYGKLRGNYAVVGKDAMPYLYDRRFKQFGTFPDNGYGIDPTLSSADRNLMPELAYSWEIGADFRFFDNKTRLDLAYYSVKNDNQIVVVRVSPASGYILQTRNEGAIRNHGFEFSLEQDIIKNRNFLWTSMLNFGFNRGKVVSLPENVSEITGDQYGDIFTSAYLGASTTAISGKDYLRTEDGKIIVNELGYPQIGPRKDALIGNREPKFLAGLTNTFRYKDLSFSFLLNGRVGGDVANVTERGLISMGQSKMLEQYRGRQIVVDGVVKLPDGTYAPNTSAITLNAPTLIDYFFAVSSNFIEDGSFLRLSYVTLGWDLSRYVKNTSLKGLRCSLTANNLFLLTKYTGADPTLNANTSRGGTGSAGIDNYAVPNTTGYNLTISASF